jgi:AraC family transcriptional regulator, regulatory protein of adaptative response / DNA-3-methyladenine glycosylase II
VSLDANSCYRALRARDSRFDGLFFVAVKTTGVYCRPICPARLPRQERCLFFQLPAEAEHAGFRACFRCRPELAPGRAPIDRVPNLVQRAVARIDAGYLNEASVDDLASELGVTGRQLRRAMDAELGLSPVEMAQTQRLRVAKQLLADTNLPVLEVAYASGFSSLRRFNASLLERFGRAPSALRRKSSSGARDSLELRLDFRPPLDFSTMLAFLGERSLAGVEQVADDAYRRTVQIAEHTGWLAVRQDPKRSALVLQMSSSLTPKLMQIVRRVRRVFDLDAQPEVIDAHLMRDRRLARLVQRHRGLRPPGAFDGFEISVRAILGQQVSVKAATTLATRLVQRFGHEVEAPWGLERTFPSAEKLADAGAKSIARIGLPATRAQSIHELARRVTRKEIAFDSESLIHDLPKIPGIGEWTAAYVAMRALGDPDAFVAGDIALWRALGVDSRNRAIVRAERWRPWRAYAVIQLWTSLIEGSKS